MPILDLSEDDLRLKIEQFANAWFTSEQRMDRALELLEKCRIAINQLDPGRPILKEIREEIETLNIERKNIT